MRYFILATALEKRRPLTRFSGYLKPANAPSGAETPEEAAWTK